jgi:hypothetical protein
MFDGKKWIEIFFGADAGADLATRTIQELKAARRWAPAFDQMKLPALFAELAKSETKIEFGEGDKKSTKTALEILAGFLMGLPEISVVNFTEVPGFKANPESIEILTAARARATGRNITFGEALTEVYGEKLNFTEVPGFTASAESIAAATAARARMTGRNITFNEALTEVHAEQVKFTETASLQADPESIATAAAARARAREKQITFGDALAEIYAERAAAGAHR